MKKSHSPRFTRLSLLLPLLLLLALLIAPGAPAAAAPTAVTVDGDLSDAEYVTVATKQNANAGFGASIDTTAIKFFNDTVNEVIYIGVAGKLDTSSNNGIGLWLNISNATGAAAGTPLGFAGAGHYMDGQGGGTDDNFQADFEVDYMFALNPGSGSTDVYIDAAKKVGGDTAQYLGNVDQSGTSATSQNSDFFSAGSVTMAFNNGGGADQGFEMAIPYSELGLTDTTGLTFEAFAFVVSDSGFFSDVTVPGNVTTGNPGFNADFNTLSGGPYHSSFGPTAISLVAATATASLPPTLLLTAVAGLLFMLLLSAALLARRARSRTR